MLVLALLFTLLGGPAAVGYLLKGRRINKVGMLGGAAGGLLGW